MKERSLRTSALRPVLVLAAIASLGAAMSASAQDDYVGSGVEARPLTRPVYEVVADAVPFTMSQADLQLAEQAIERLRADHMIQGRIAVSALNGVVMLNGGVRSVPMIYRAVELLRDMDTVRAVNVNELDKDPLTVWRNS